MKQDSGLQRLSEQTVLADQNGDLVSVIILNYNGLRTLGQVLDECLSSVLKATYSSFEVLFVDNASTDGSVEYVQGCYRCSEKLRIIKNENNLGFAEGNNRGIGQAKGKYIVLLNSDTRVDPNWLTELVKAVQPIDVGAAQSRLIRMDVTSELDCAGGFVDYYGYHFERGRGESPLCYNRLGEIFYAKGASALFKRETLEKTGLFDPDIFMYFDEVDLCWRIWLGGYKVVYAPASIVFHASGSTAAMMQSASRLYLYTRNHLAILLKNYNLANALKAVKVSFLFETRNVVLLLARKRPLVALAVMKALFWNLSHLKQTWTKRQKVQVCVRRVSDEEVRRHMLKPLPTFPLYITFSRSKYE
jgi:GT2 family glycosyltransferase